MILRAPAKVNLHLSVLNKRPDGYHNIETIFERIALFDKIVIRSLKKSKIKISCDNPGIPTDKNSLIYRAAELLKKECHVPNGVKIKIDKKIPIASGLGGGSSDTAAVLTGLNKVWKLSLKPDALIAFGKRLGADIPFFLTDGSFAMASGRGDEIIPLRWRAKLWHVLVSCETELLSKDIYSAYSKKTLRGSAKKARLNKRRFPRSAEIKFEGVKNLLNNDLEQIVLGKAPFLSELKGAMKDLSFGYSLVSGSGPSIFGLFKKRKEAVRAKALLVKRFPVIKRRGWQVFIVPTL